MTDRRHSVGAMPIRFEKENSQRAASPSNPFKVPQKVDKKRRASMGIMKMTSEQSMGDAEELAKKRKREMDGKRVSFGVVDIRTFNTQNAVAESVTVVPDSTSTAPPTEEEGLFSPQSIPTRRRSVGFAEDEVDFLKPSKSFASPSPAVNTDELTMELTATRWDNELSMELTKQHGGLIQLTSQNLDREVSSEPENAIAEDDKTGMDFTRSVGKILQSNRRLSSPVSGNFMLNASDISEPVVGEKTMEITRSLGSIRQSALAFQSPVSISKAMYTQTASSAMASPIQPELSMDLTKAFGSIKAATPRVASPMPSRIMSRTSPVAAAFNERDLQSTLNSILEHPPASPNVRQPISRRRSSVGAPLDSSVDMEFTQSLGSIAARYGSVTLPEVDDTEPTPVVVEDTNKTSLAALLTRSAQIAETLDSKKSEMMSEESSSSASPPQAVQAEVEELTMELTQHVGQILIAPASAFVPALAMSPKSVEAAITSPATPSRATQDVVLDAVTMEITKNFSSIIRALTPRSNKKASAPVEQRKSLGMESELTMANKFNALLAGDMDEPTMNLPRRDRLSVLAGDMANLLEQIMHGVDRPGQLDISLSDDEAPVMIPPLPATTMVPLEAMIASPTPTSTSARTSPLKQLLQRTPIAVVQPRTPLSTVTSPAVAAPLGDESNMDDCATADMRALVTPRSLRAVLASVETPLSAGAPVVTPGSYKKPESTPLSTLKQKRTSLPPAATPRAQGTPTKASQLARSLTPLSSSVSTPAATPGPAVDATEIKNLRDFLWIIGFKGFLDSPKQADRRKSVGAEQMLELARSWGDVSMHEEDDATTAVKQQQLAAAMVQAPFVDSTNKICLDVLDQMEQLEQAVAAIEGKIQSNPLALFKTMPQMSAAERDTLNAKFGMMNEMCQLLARCSWNKISRDLVEMRKNAYKTQLNLIQADIDRFDALAARLHTMRDWNEVWSNEEINALRKKIEEQGDSIEMKVDALKQQKARLVALAESVSSQKQQMLSAREQAAALRSEITAAQQREAENTNQQNLHAVTAAANGWKKMKSSESEIRARFLDIYELQASIAADGQITMAPTLSLALAAKKQSTAVESYRRAIFGHLCKNQTLQSLLSCCSHITQFAGLQQSLQLWLRRAESCVCELQALSSKFSIYLSDSHQPDVCVNKPSGPAAPVAVINVATPTAEVVLRLHLAALFTGDIDILGGPSGVTVVTADCRLPVQSAADKAANANLLTAALSIVEAASNKQGGRLTTMVHNLHRHMLQM
jgi:hypothetical protein